MIIPLLAVLCLVLFVTCCFAGCKIESLLKTVEDRNATIVEAHTENHERCIQHIAAFLDADHAASVLRDAAHRYDSGAGKAALQRIGREQGHDPKMSLPAKWMLDLADIFSPLTCDDHEHNMAGECLP